jgi:hypothetical protein
MLSGFQVSTSPTPDFSVFNEFAKGMNCTESPGSQRLQCLRNVSASTIRDYTNGPDGGIFRNYLIDKYVFYPTEDKLFMSLVV